MTKPRDRMASSLNVTAAELNSFYALTSTDPAYEEVSLKSTANPFQQTITEEQVFSILDHLQPTADGYDKIPAWFLRLLAPVCSRCLAHLINLHVSLVCPSTVEDRSYPPGSKDKSPPGSS